MLAPEEIDEICRRVDLRALASDLGARFRGRSNYGSCPKCGGGKSAARFEIKPGRAWVCAVCETGGDAIKLLMHVEEIGFREAVARLGGPVALSPEARARAAERRAKEEAARTAQADAYRQRERRALFEVWTRAAPLIGSPAEAYLRLRGLDWKLDALDLKCALRGFFHGEDFDERGRKNPRRIFEGPAMLAAFVGPDGRFLGLHQTWIDLDQPEGKARIFDPDTGEALIPKKMRGHKSGGYLRLTRGGDFSTLYAGEGVESTLSVRQAMRDAFVYRAAGDLGNLAGKATASVAHPTLTGPKGRPQRVGGDMPDFDSEAMPVPDATRELVLVRDGDSDAFTTDLAMLRAGRRHAARGRRVRVAAPPPGLDFNDWLRGRHVPA